MVSFAVCSPSGEPPGSAFALMLSLYIPGTDQGMNSPCVLARGAVLSCEPMFSLAGWRVDSDPPPPPITPWRSRQSDRCPGGDCLLCPQLVGVNRAHNLPQGCAIWPTLDLGCVGESRALAFVFCYTQDTQGGAYRCQESGLWYRPVGPL